MHNLCVLIMIIEQFQFVVTFLRLVTMGYALLAYSGIDSFVYPGGRMGNLKCNAVAQGIEIFNSCLLSVAQEEVGKEMRSLTRKQSYKLALSPLNSFGAVLLVAVCESYQHRLKRLCVSSFLAKSSYLKTLLLWYVNGL